MIDISVHELNKYYGANHVIKGISFEIYSGERVGLLGKNGSGKTTMFKIISGEEYYESGNVAKATGKKIEMLAQIPIFGENETVDNILYSSFKEIRDIYREMKSIEGDEKPSVLARYGFLMDEYQRLGGYDTEVKMNKICNGMIIDESMRKNIFSTLSGGEQTRVNLARILLRDCDILLLDEPTNHLDLNTLEWLEKYLCEYSGTVVIISHDRAFLDSVVTRIIEINDGKANFYRGNYSSYVEERERRILSQTEQYEQQQKKIHQLEVAAKRLHEWAKLSDSEALHKRAFSIEKRIEKMDKVERPNIDKKLTVGFDSGGYAAKEIVSFDDVSKGYGEKTIIKNLNIKVYRNDIIAIVGVNGCGKSTLLKMIMGDEQCCSGTMKVSVNVKAAYMPQIIEFENSDATVLETLRSQEQLSEEKARSILARFNFRAPDVMKKVGTLSGGEKSRLKLCLMMQSNINFLLLDEPTNHLDIVSREWIENALADFDGTIIIVSHDRYFLKKFATKVWSMDGGNITVFTYGFEEYVVNTRLLESKSKKSKTQSPKEVKKILSVKTASTEELIEQAEIQLKGIDAAMESCVQKAEYLKIDILIEEKRQLEEKLEVLYSQWIDK